jgi:hypothetical protein
VPNGVAFLIATLPLIGMFLTWSFLQWLPRSSKFRWSIVSRILSTGILVLVAALYGGVVSEFINLRFDEDWLTGIAFMGLLVEWRCFISVERYTRVGTLRTLFATTVFFVLASLTSRLEQETIAASAMICAVVVSIQLFAPQYQDLDNVPDNAKPRMTRDNKQPWTNWLTRAETSPESDMKENVHV